MLLVLMTKAGGLMIIVQPSPFLDRLPRFLAVGFLSVTLGCVIAPEVRGERDNAIFIRVTRDIDEVSALGQQAQQLGDDVRSHPQNVDADTKQMAQLNATVQRVADDLPEALAARKVVSAEIQLWTTVCRVVGSIAFVCSVFGFIWWFRDDRCSRHGEPAGILKAAAA